MQMEKKTYIFRIGVVFAIGMLCSYFVCAQQNYSSLESARYWEREGNIQSAAYFYRDYLSTDLQAPIAIHYTCALLMKDIFHYTDAIFYFEKVVKSDSLDSYPDALFWLGMVQKNKGQYSEAKQSFQRYQQKYASSADSLLQKRIVIELHSFDMIEKYLTDTLPVLVEKVPHPVNTEYSEFNAIQMGDEALYFSSIRQLSGSEQNSILEDFYMGMIFVAPYTVNGIREITPLPATINNHKYNNANFCFNEDKTKLFFTRCPIYTKKNRHCAIWVSDYVDGKWGKPHKLDKNINHPNSNNTQPYLANTNHGQILFFVSDRKDGYGGMDIWQSRLIEDYFDEAVNLGSIINSSGDEITPFYHSETQTLYFSSNWHEGFGGFDMFKSKGALNTWEQPANLGYPLNSPANDMYFTINETDKDGFFTSNRVGSFYTTDETCCNDIYEYQWQGKVETVQRDTFLVKDIAVISKSINDILPITLYFHNDEPNPRSRATTTDKDYKRTLEEYYAMKDHYKNEYSKGLAGEEARKARNDIDSFFTHTVGKGFEHLEQFVQWLHEDLQQGNNVDITIIGFASPLHSDEYNANLSSRRIASLKNFIYHQQIFDSYLDTTTSGNKLRFIEDPRGKRFAAEYVSGNPNDVRNSVYSIAAALERRIQITLYKSAKDTSQQQPELFIAENNITVKQQPETDKYELYVQLKNIGNSPLTINNVHSTVGMMQAEIDNKSLQAGETTWVKISLSADVFGKIDKGGIIIQDNTKTQQIEIMVNDK